MLTRFLPPWLLFFLFVGACSSRANLRAQSPGKSLTPLADASYRPPRLSWWRGLEPVCSIGNLVERKTEWGGVYWCELAGHDSDLNLQNDLGALAKCLHSQIRFRNQEPNKSQVYEFAKRAKKKSQSGAIGSCEGIGRRGALLGYRGQEIAWERRELPTAAVAAAGLRPGKWVQYRFGCKNCLVGSYLRVELPQH